MLKRTFSSFLLALAACGGGSEGANTADEETSAAPTVQAAVPENLTDDPRNEAVPLDPPPSPKASATPAPSATPARLSAFPADYQGRWGLVAADCTPGRDDAKGLMEVGANTLRFYESRGVATALTRPRPARVEAKLDFTGEGRNWAGMNALTLINDNTLVREERDPATSLRYARCPEPA